MVEHRHGTRSNPTYFLNWVKENGFFPRSKKSKQKSKDELFIYVCGTDDAIHNDI